LIRLEGFGPSVADRLRTLEMRFARDIQYLSLDPQEGACVWREIRDVAPLVDPAHIVWRISLPAADAAGTVSAIAQATSAEAFYDWGGGLVWLAMPSKDEAHAELVRSLLPSGHATLMRAPVACRAKTQIFNFLPPALAALQRRVKSAFDPAGILSPGRLSLES
jgi:glycolate oxidase FAD binding subunit